MPVPEWGSEEYKEAQEKIAQHITEAHAALNKAIKLSEESGVYFNFSPSYGMGGSYVPKAVAEEEKREYDPDWDGSLDEAEDYGWMPSSVGC